jgi:1-acyl-sn-glycerol-3-phosphate acyltransferase
MSIVRVLLRCLLLVPHVLYGLLRALTLRRQHIGAGVDLPDPEPVARWHGRLCRILGVDIRVSGEVPHRGALLAANHISWLDIPVLGSLTHSGFLSKAEVRRWPLVGRLAAAAGTLFIHRGAGEVREVTEAIRHRLVGDRQLVIFAEGTTTDGTGVRPFFPRLFGAAIDSGTPVIPVTIAYDLDGAADTAVAFIDDHPLTRSLWTVLRRKRTRARVVFHAPIDSTGMDRRSLAAAARTRVEVGLANRLPPFDR